MVKIMGRNIKKTLWEGGVVLVFESCLMLKINMKELLLNYFIVLTTKLPFLFSELKIKPLG